MCYQQAQVEYITARFATDWAQGVLWFADNELSLSVVQPVEYAALEQLLETIVERENAAYSELEFYGADEPFYTAEQAFKH